ncbi:hypothetical protein QYF36_021633 [Acer negundo]|nr:hypothetical protein QYF36_021633 [Acer negundo]
MEELRSSFMPVYQKQRSFVSSAKKSAMANRREGSELIWKETEKRIGEDWVVELRLCLVVMRPPFMEKFDLIWSMSSAFMFCSVSYTRVGWRKISFYFNISYEIKDKTIEFDEYCNVQRAEFVVRAYMQGGRFSDGWSSCERREKRLLKPNHDIPSTAETRAKNKACQDLLGIGEYRPDVSQC